MSTRVLDEFRASGLDLDSLPGNTAKLRLALDLAQELRDGRRLRILDVGCAGPEPLNLWLPFLPLAEDIELVGVDVAGIDRVQARADDVGLAMELRAASALELVATFGAGSFDAAVSTQVLEHVPDWRAALRELRDVVRPGGRVYVTCDSGDLERPAATRAKLAGKRGYAKLRARIPAVDVVGRRLVSGEWEQGPTRAELAAASTEVGLTVERLDWYGLQDVKRAQRTGGSGTRQLALALEETLADEAGHALDPSPYALLYLCAVRTA